MPGVGRMSRKSYQTFIQRRQVQGEQSEMAPAAQKRKGRSRSRSTPQKTAGHEVMPAPETPKRMMARRRSRSTPRKAARNAAPQTPKRKGRSRSRSTPRKTGPSRGGARRNAMDRGPGR